MNRVLLPVLTLAMVLLVGCAATRTHDYTLTRDGIQLHYELTRGGDESYVFVHGWCCNREYFAPQAKYFAAKSHTVLALDLRGHGVSTAPEGTSITIADFAADVVAIIAAAGLDKPILVGHSMGGTIVLNIAVEYPENVGGIVMVDPAPLVWTDDTKKRIDQIVESMLKGDQGPRREFVENVLFSPYDDVTVKEKVLADMLATPVHVAVAALKSVQEFDGPGMASRCKVPTLHIGAAVPLNPLAQVEELLDGVVSGQTVGAGHLHQLLVPTQINDMIEKFARVYVWKDGPR